MFYLVVITMHLIDDNELLGVKYLIKDPTH